MQLNKQEINQKNMIKCKPIKNWGCIVKKKQIDVNWLMDEMKKEKIFQEESFPINLYSTTGHPNVLFLAGDNASGKSYIAHKLARAAYKSEYGIEPMLSSMRARSTEGVGRAMIFGSENNSSTGTISIRTIIKAFDSVKNRVEDQGGAVIVIDEPELGLSESYRMACGEVIGERIRNALNDEAVDHSLVVVIISHSRELMKGLVKEMQCEPTFISLNLDATLEQWMEHTPVYSKEHLLNLTERAKDMRKAINETENVVAERKKIIERHNVESYDETQELVDDYFQKEQYLDRTIESLNKKKFIKSKQR